MATITPYRGGIVTRGTLVTKDFTEAASQSYKAGGLVILSSGKVAEAATSGNAVTSASTIIGIAASDASGTTDTKATVHCFTEMCEILLPIYNNTSAVTQIGTAYVAYNNSGVWSVDVATSTNGVMTVTEFPKAADGNSQAVGDTTPYVWCKPSSALMID